MGSNQTARERLAAQWLTGPAAKPSRTPIDVVRHLLAVQAQDLQGARLAVRARTAGLTALDVDAALADRSLIVTWLNRGTLHLIDAQDYAWLHPLTAPRTLSGSARRLRQEGVSPAQAERGVEVVVRAIETGGPQTRAQLKAQLDEAGVPTKGQALIHVLAAASLAGVTVRGPMVGADQGYVLVRDWLGPTPAVDREQALGRLADRYLAGHHPSTDADLAAWAGITLGDARRALAIAAASPPDARSPDAGTPDAGSPDAGFAARTPTVRLSSPQLASPQLPNPRSPTPRLLGPFDPALHGWPDREWLIGPYRHVVTVNGIFRPTVLVGGRVVGTWARPRGVVTLDLFEDVDPAALTALDAEAVDVQRFLGGAGSARLTP